MKLISNASDAIDKIYFKSLTDKSLKIKRENLAIRIAVSKENRTITISDNGCGMNESELETNLGTIAESGSSLFKEENKGKRFIYHRSIWCRFLFCVHDC